MADADPKKDLKQTDLLQHFGEIIGLGEATKTGDKGVISLSRISTNTSGYIRAGRNNNAVTLVLRCLLTMKDAEKLRGEYPQGDDGTPAKKAGGDVSVVKYSMGADKKLAPQFEVTLDKPSVGVIGYEVDPMYANDCFTTVDTEIPKNYTVAEIVINGVLKDLKVNNQAVAKS